MAKLNLDNDVVFVDIEATGLSKQVDRIVQLAMIKMFKDGRPTEERCRLINPLMPISEEAMKVHKITNEMVSNQPTFKQLARGINEFIGNSDLITFNGNRYDIPIICEEFNRADVNFSLKGRRTVDVQRIYHQFEKRNLSAAIKFYLGEEVHNKITTKLHDALNDCRYTKDVLEKMIDKYNNVNCDGKLDEIIIAPVKNSIQALHDFTNDPNNVDFTGRFKYNKERIPVFSFGKYQEKPVGESFAKDEKYLKWFMDGDFPADAKRTAMDLTEEYKDQVR